MTEHGVEAHSIEEHSIEEHSIEEHSIEEPEEDVAEQSQEVSPVAGEAPLFPERAPLEANEADVEEQARVVELDEDEYH